MSATFVTVVVINTAGVGVAKGKATVQGATVTQALSPGIASGGYRIAFRVTSDDGHPVTGESKFTLRLASGASPTTSARTPSLSPTDPVQETPPPEGAPADQANWPTRFLAPIAGALGLLVIGAAGLLWDRRRR